MTTAMGVGDRLCAVLDELGIQRTHVGAGLFFADFQSLAEMRPAATGSLTCVLPNLVPQIGGVPDYPVAGIFGQDSAGSIQRSRAKMASWPNIQVRDLPDDYPADVWSDAISDQADTVIAAIRDNSRRASGVDPVNLESGERQIQEVRVRIHGSGPPLLLLPAGLTPSQWDAPVEALSNDFTVIRVSGVHLGMISGLETRAATPGYTRMIDSFFDELQIKDGETIVEIGSGTGALVRQLAIRTQNRNKIIAGDLSSSMLDEARSIAAARVPGSEIEFRFANAESLPFEDESVDVAYSVTVFEECDAEKAIAELHRVLKPGGRAGVLVRATDIPDYWSINIPADLRDRLAQKPSMITAKGCGDRRLYEMFGRHFSDLRPHTDWWADAPPRDHHVANHAAFLDEDDRASFREAAEAGIRAGTAFHSHPLHCVVGKKE